MLPADDEIEIESTSSLAKIQQNPDLLDKLIMYNSKVLSNAELLDGMDFSGDTDFSKTLQTLLIKNVHDISGLKKVSKLPGLLQKYIQYENPTPLPEFMMEQIECKDQNLIRKYIRFVLGIYPENIK